MKIQDIVPDLTKPATYTVRTDPPITDEIFKHLNRDSLSFKVSQCDEFIELRKKSDPTRADLKQLTEALTQAEQKAQAVERQKQAECEQHNEFLTTLSKSTGLPIGKPSVPKPAA